MKIGLKLYPKNLDLIKKYACMFDFFEIYIKPDFDVKLLRNYKDVNMIVHASHNAHGFNPSDTKKREQNELILRRAVNAANIVGSPYVIVHTGTNSSVRSKQDMLDFFEKNWDNKIIFENCTIVDLSKGNEKYLFATPEEMRVLLKKFNCGFVLDFGHAICTANILGVSPNKIINDFFKLKPSCYHISGIDIDSKIDIHNSLFNVNNRFDFIKKIPFDKFVTLETPAKDFDDKEIQQKNINFLRGFNVKI